MEYIMKILGRISCLGLLFLAAFLVHLPSELCVSLAIPPDSSEYSVCLSNLFEHGKFGFTLNGEWYPSRYSPWFSLFCLSPAYLFFWGDVFALHWAVLVFSLVYLVLAYKLGESVGLGKWAILCAMLPLFIPDFVFYSRMIMTEIPYTALLAASALAFVRFADDESPSLLFCLGAGALVAWGGAVRPTALPMLAPFALVVFCWRCGWRRKIASIVLLSVPALSYLVANLTYNKCVFGSPFRSGYHFWAAVPCDYPDIAFNVRYVLENVVKYLCEPVTAITATSVVFVMAVAVFVLNGRFGGIRRNRHFLLISGYVLFQGLVLLSLYCGYYWCDIRFFLPLMLCVIPLVLWAVALLFGGVETTSAKVALLLITVVCVCCMRFITPRYYYMVGGFTNTIVEAGISNAVIPDKSVVLQGCNPLFLDYLCPKGKRLEHFPLHRGFDYANTMVAPTPINNLSPRPVSCWQRIVPELVTNGVCRLPFPRTLKENPEKIKEIIDSGERVFVQRGCYPAAETRAALGTLLSLKGIALKAYGSWEVPAIEANPVRHVYDRYLFPAFSMDTRPLLQSYYHELVPQVGVASEGGGHE